MAAARIGNQAEALFMGLCAKANATVNKSIQDERGWDFFVEFPHRDDNDCPLPLDLEQHPGQCLIQVKGTASSTHRIALKLSNAQAFAKNPLPCFIVLLPYSKDAQSGYAYLIHFWEGEIARTLEKSRRLDVKGRRDSHRASLLFGHDAMRLIPVDELLATIREIIRNSGGPGYAKRKRSIEERVGFSGQKYEGSLTLCAPWQEIVDMNLGLKDHVQATSISLRSVRFGLPAGTPMINNMAGAVSMRSTPEDCIVTISSELRGIEASLPCKLFRPSIANVPEQFVRFRVVHPLFEMIIHHHNRSVNYRAACTSDQRGSLSDVATAITLARVFSSHRLYFQLFVEGKRVLGGSHAIKPTRLLPFIDSAGTFVDTLMRECRPHEIPADLKLNIDDLLVQRDDILEFNALATCSSVDGHASLNPGIDFKGKVLLSPGVSVNGHSIYAIVKRNIRMTRIGLEQVMFRLGKVDYARIRILHGTIDSTEGTIEKEIDILRSNLGRAMSVTLPRRGTSENAIEALPS